jgi:uncharacterized protein Yka (UPF0111/DUF47 family)
MFDKEEKYYSNFKELVSNVHEIGNLTNQLFSADVPDTSILLKINPTQHRCDEVFSKIVKSLNKSFITPIDREDIFALGKRLNSIADMLVNASVRIDTFNINRKIRYADQLSEIILQQLVELDNAIQDLQAKKTNELKLVKDLEVKADEIYSKAIKDLFNNQSNPIELIKEKEILEFLENAADKCQSAANVIMSIFIKNA